jgi:hypothetical protein
LKTRLAAARRPLWSSVTTSLTRRAGRDRPASAGWTTASSRTHGISASEAPVATPLRDLRQVASSHKHGRRPAGRPPGGMSAPAGLPRPTPRSVARGRPGRARRSPRRAARLGSSRRLDQLVDRAGQDALDVVDQLRCSSLHDRGQGLLGHRAFGPIPRRDVSAADRRRGSRKAGRHEPWRSLGVRSGAPNELDPADAGLGPAAHGADRQRHPSRSARARHSLVGHRRLERNCHAATGVISTA